MARHFQGGDGSHWLLLIATDILLGLIAFATYLGHFFVAYIEPHVAAAASCMSIAWFGSRFYHDAKKRRNDRK